MEHKHLYNQGALSAPLFKTYVQPFKRVNPVWCELQKRGQRSVHGCTVFLQGDLAGAHWFQNGSLAGKARAAKEGRRIQFVCIQMSESQGV